MTVTDEQQAELRQLQRLSGRVATARAKADVENAALRSAIHYASRIGISYDDIAAVCGITKQRVEQIVRRERNGASGKTGGRPPKVKADA